MIDLLLALIVALVAVGLNYQAAMQVEVDVRQFSIGYVVASMLGFFVFALPMALTGMVWFSWMLAILVCVGLWYVNAVKFRILGEPLVLTDVFLLGQVVSHPHLYISHFERKPLLHGALPSVLLLIAVWLAPRDAAAGNAQLACALLLAMISGGMVLLLVAAWQGRLGSWLDAWGLRFSPVVDAGRVTPLGAALLHLLHHVAVRGAGGPDTTSVSLIAKELPVANRPHVLVVQAESYCDMSRFLPQMSSDPVRNLLPVRTNGLSGHLCLSWRGAYTMRTEFSVLTGRDVRTLGTFGFDPYRLAMERPLPSLASALQARGYRTVCVHPYDKTFFNRHLVMPNLGFDEFVDVSQLGECPRNGPYISDAALLRYAAERCSKGETPLFLFVITMESHGPWQQGRFSDKPGLSDLEMYLHHLDSLDQGVASCLSSTSSDRALVFALYGDHLPSLDLLRGKFVHETATDYVVWDSRTPNAVPERRDIHPAELANLILARVDSTHSADF